MRRGELYRVSRERGSSDPRSSRLYAVVGRQAAIDGAYSTVICAPVYSNYHGISTQVPVGEEHGLKYPSSIHCDNLASIRKAALRDYVGSLDADTMRLLDIALRSALSLE